MRIGSLFSGYGGLDLALHDVLPDAETVFVADVCKHTKTDVGHHEPHRSPCTILAERFPGVPNLGDVSLVDWTPWRGRVDVLAAGFPCQDVSQAGTRSGLHPGTRSGLWSEVVRAIRDLQPRLVALENVPGIFTAPAAGDVEPCTWCLGDRPAGHLRALDAVLADLATLGFDAEWTTLRASDVGAAHRRERWFCLAYPAGDEGRELDRDGRPAAHAPQLGHQRSGITRERRTRPSDGDCVCGHPLDEHSERAGLLCLNPACTNFQRGVRCYDTGGGRPPVTCPCYLHYGRPQPLSMAGPCICECDHTGDPGDLLPTPRATDGTKGGPGQRGSSGDLMLPSAVARMLPTPTSRDHKDHTIRREPHRPDDADTLARALTSVPAALLPTPAVNDMGEGKTVERWDAWTADMRAKHGNGNGYGKSLAIEAQRLLPTIKATNNETRQTEGYDNGGETYHAILRDPARWGDYAAAITRWEHILGRPAPEPTQLSSKGNPQLAGAFTEWLMGLPGGWITDVPGITRAEVLKACGNGVVPLQASTAYRHLLDRIAGQVAA